MKSESRDSNSLTIWRVRLWTLSTLRISKYLVRKNTIGNLTPLLDNTEAKWADITTAIAFPECQAETIVVKAKKLLARPYLQILLRCSTKNSMRVFAELRWLITAFQNSIWIRSLRNQILKITFWIETNMTRSIEILCLRWISTTSMTSFKSTCNLASG